jgi:hypothetical protein
VILHVDLDRAFAQVLEERRRQRAIRPECRG